MYVLINQAEPYSCFVAAVSSVILECLFVYCGGDPESDFTACSGRETLVSSATWDQASYTSNCLL
jgi:hypothetical protein